MHEETLVRHLGYPPEIAWDFLADLRHDPLWRREIVRSDLVGGAAREAGAEYRELVLWEGINAEVLITTPELQRGVLLSVHVHEPGYESTYTYEFTPAVDGCEVRLRMCIDTMGPLRLIEPFMWAIITRWIEQSLAGLDDVIAAHLDQGEALPNVGHV